MTQTAWEDVPWAVGGEGVKHNSNVARLVAHVAFGGREGIVGSRDLEVAPMDTPNDTIRVMPGACGINVRNPSLTNRYESYAAKLPAQDVVPISPTGSDGSRCDLVVARVENPFMAGEPYTRPSAQAIADGTASFVRTAVLTMNNGSRHPTRAEIENKIGTQSAIALASILIPANTGTINAGMIRSQRVLSKFQNYQDTAVLNPDDTVTLNSNDYKNIASAGFEIPPWATHATIKAWVSGARFGAPGTRGGVRVAMDSVVAGTSVVYGQGIAFDEQTANNDRMTLMAAGRQLFITGSKRGEMCYVRLQGNRTQGAQPVTIDKYTAVSFDVAYTALPESNFAALNFA